MKIREVRFEDLSAVRALVKVHGWNPPTEVYWRRLWDENPAMKRLGDDLDLARGWVIEHDGVVLGFLANVFQQFCYRGNLLTAATASSFVVAQEARGSALNLAIAFASQRGVDLLLNTTAAAHVSQIFQFIKFKRMPQPGYGSIYYWIADGKGFIAAGLQKVRVPRGVSKVIGFVAGPFLEIVDRIRGRSLAYQPSPNFTYEIRKLNDVDDEIADLWKTLCERGGQLTIARSPETLRWQLSIRDDSDAALICARKDKHLVGYAAIVRAIKPRMGLVRYRLVDLLAQNNESAILDGLLRTAFDYAKSEGAHILDTQGFNQSVVEVMLATNPRCHVNHDWPYLFKTNDPALAEELERPECWYTSMLDGDTCLEPSPASLSG
jgi:hypothetical protein